ncbi:DUF4249 domain-containing protein [Fulvivirga ligni]|uniref:DUF4249 domain-containing protein n=1 Tax=Fulvivirga ligni TaxID=2904246 RepID=UPI001F3A4C49|nr:DUF4249 domain-containing protein [Fulvivirga ligni]UII19806.1 DUF4249 domain-containing protein [Fulvivirga ligni]
MRFHNTILYILLSIAVMSCIDDVDPEKFDIGEEKVVINGVISPSDTVIRVQVSHTKAIIGEYEYDLESQLVEPDAEVLLSNEDGLEVALTYSQNSRMYEVKADDFTLVPGKNYFLAVSLRGKTYRSQCTIPAGEITEMGHRVKRVDEYETDLSVSFRDIAGEENFYRVGAFTNSEAGGGSIASFGIDTFQNDNVGDGATITAISDYFYYYGEDDSITVQVANIEEVLYRYQYAKYNYEGDDPFTEPVAFPSNIEGDAIGIFTGYTYFTKKFKLEN